MKRKISLQIVCILFLVTILSPTEYNSPEIISIEKNTENIEKLKGTNLDFLMEWGNRIFIISKPGDLIKLRDKDIPYLIETNIFYPSDGQTISIQTSVNGEFHSYSELEADLMTLQESYPQLAKVIDIGDSLEKRNIYALKISDNVQMDEAEAAMILLGCHHAREWISLEVPFLIGKHLLENYDTNSEIKRLVDHCEIWIVPLVNPDGLEYSINFYRYWRKNRRDIGDGKYGVDPNRNFSYMWGFDDEGSSANAYAEDYRGILPFSEPETQAIRDLFTQNNFQALISYHSYTQIILYPWGYKHEPPIDDALLNFMAAEMSSRMQAVNGRVYSYGRAGDSLYLTNGDATDWSYGVYGIPSFTIELPPIDRIHGGFFNSEEDIQSIFAENLPAALYLIDWTIQQKDEITP